MSDTDLLIRTEDFCFCPLYFRAFDYRPFLKTPGRYLLIEHPDAREKKSYTLFIKGKTENYITSTFHARLNHKGFFMVAGPESYYRFLTLEDAVLFEITTVERRKKLVMKPSYNTVPSLFYLTSVIVQKHFPEIQAPIIPRLIAIQLEDYNGYF